MPIATRALSYTLLVAGVLGAGAGCSTAPVAPAYTQDELRTRCERQRGMWHPDALAGGFCEYRAASRPEPAGSPGA